MESLRQDEREAMAAEAKALEAEEDAREALESWVADGEEGDDMQDAFFRAKEETEKASGDLAARTARLKAAEAALERAREELKQAGEDTRTLADKRKRSERPGGGRGPGREEPEEA